MFVCVSVCVRKKIGLFRLNKDFPSRAERKLGALAMVTETLFLKHEYREDLTC